MDLSTVTPEELRYKREIWLKPGSRMQPVNHSGAVVKDFNKNYANFYGVTPGSTPVRTPASTSSQYCMNQARFYGTSPGASANNFNKDTAKFYGVTPVQSERPPGGSRPISQTTEFQLNTRNFYAATPSEPLQYKKNTNAFFNVDKSRSPLVSAGRNLVQ